jgi:beta-glucosidase
MHYPNRQRWLQAAGSVLASFCFLAILFAGAIAGAQSADEKKISDLISKMTLEEKIHMLSGSTLMSSAGVKRLGIPEFRMSDGPSGAHVPPPSTAYAGAES